MKLNLEVFGRIALMIPEFKGDWEHLAEDREESATFGGLDGYPGKRRNSR
jgi:hypothetical protein